jgi:hypothetical protein
MFNSRLDGSWQTQGIRCSCSWGYPP